MSLRIASVVVNCADPEVMSAFWCAVLDLTPDPASSDEGFRVLSGEVGSLSLQVAADPVTARDQMHLDLVADDKDAEVARVVALGATWLRTSGDPADDYDVLRDPEGNEFCILRAPQPR